MNTTPPNDPLPVSDEGLSVPVIAEFIDVEKRSVDQGGYRMTKKVEIREETVDELLRDHGVSIERRAVGTQFALEDMPQAHYEGKTLVIPVIQEILVTEKRLVLVEEVRITPVETTHREQQNFDLRKEEIVIGRIAAREDPNPP